jgi:hypothetical protein
VCRCVDEVDLLFQLVTIVFFCVASGCCPYLNLLHGVAVTGRSPSSGILLLSSLEVVVHLDVELCRRLLGWTGAAAASLLVRRLGSTWLVGSALLLIGSGGLGLRLRLTVKMYQ